MEIKIPENVNYIIQRLIEHNHEAFAVGGCIRDSILGREPQDWDITTSARPEQVKEIFTRTVDTGIEHGTVTVLIDKEGFEVTTYRVDGEYEDNRHPKTVEFTKNLTKDLERRDFTINAMAYNTVSGLVDVFGGMTDIENKIIRCVGSAAERFDEDALRILRAIRFSAQLGFTIENNTILAVSGKCKNLRNISAERIREELNKLLLSEHPDMLLAAYETGITKIILPEFDEMLLTEQNNPHHIYNVGVHSIKAVEAVNQLFSRMRDIEQSMDSNWKYIQKAQIQGAQIFHKDVITKLDRYFSEELLSEKIRLTLCWTMLLHDMGKPMKKVTDETGRDHFYGHPLESSYIANNILTRLKFDNFTLCTVKNLVKHHDKELNLTPAGIRKAINKIGEDNIILLFFVKYADTIGQNPKKQQEKFDSLQMAMNLYFDIMDNKECISLKALAVNGKDLLEAGYEQGKNIGNLLNYLLTLVIENPKINEREKLLTLLSEYQKELTD